MPFTVYIIHSSNLNKYYVGFTADSLPERLRKHNSNHKGFTGVTNDWEYVFNKVVLTKKEGLLLEKKIKKRGAKRFLTLVP